MANPKVYVSGKMRGVKNWNFPAFDLATIELKRAGYHVISPTQMDRLYEGWATFPPENFDPSLGDFKRFIRRDLNLLLEFSPENGDAIYMLTGWMDSKGACLEKALAQFLGLTVLYE